MRRPLTEEQKARQSVRNKEWREANRESLAIKKKTYYAETKVKRAEVNRTWRSANKERVSQYRKSHWARHGAEELARRKENYDPIVHLGRNLKKAYGLTLAEANRMLADQGYKCATCSQEFEESFELAQKALDNHRKPNIDHNHSTGKVRAILCGRCNRALGFARESKEILISLISYLGRYE